MAVDLNGTIATRGKLIDGVIPLLKRFVEQGITISILTGDVFGTAAQVKTELENAGVPVELVLCNDSRGTAYAKAQWMNTQLSSRVAFVGNGSGDWMAAGLAGISLGVCESEGLASEMREIADVTFTSIHHALSFALEASIVRSTLHI